MALAWDRLHPRLTHRGPWLGHDGQLPLVEGTLIRLQVEHLPGERDPKPVWLWSSVTDATVELVNVFWQVFLRRFDLEHTFRLFQQTLGWIRPKLRAPESADHWTWLILTVHTQLRLARSLVEDHRRPWEKPVAQPRRADAGPGSARVSQPPRHDRPPGRRTETLPTRSWTTARLDQPAPRNPLRHRQDGQTRPHDRTTLQPHRLNNQLTEFAA